MCELDILRSVNFYAYASLIRYCRMAVIVQEESMTLYKDANVFTAVVSTPGSSTAFGQVATNDFSNI